jgi:Fe-S-cluster-containing dehydrogenase component
VLACPYKARNLDSGAFYTEGTPKIEAYETSPTWEYSRRWPREKHHIPIGNARKCHFCYHRIKHGMIPMCVSTCIARANYFGDPEDKESLIYKVMKANKISVLKSVKSNGEGKLAFAQLKDLTSMEVAKKIGYPGKAPVFADSAPTKPRVYYILP